jgi:hypothetical protein
LRSMTQFNDKQITEYMYRCFTAVDGLWFMKLEEKYGFDTALEIDNEVWKVMPKIQARMLKSMGKPGNGIEALSDCFTFKLRVEGFTFKTERIKKPRGFRVIIEKCPWFDLLVKSGRENVAEKVGTTICNTDGSAWASEFGDNIKFELQSQLCNGSERCIMQFSY